MKNNLPVFLFALFALAAAKAETNVVSEVPAVTVIASPITQEESIAKNGSDTTTISRNQLAQLNAQDLQTALRQVPGIAVSRYAPIGSYGGAQGGSVYVRGMGTARPGGEVRMYTDGVPRGSGMWSHPLMDSMPIDFAESVAVQKSPHPARYADTFGAVDIETRRRRRQGYEGEFDLAYGRYNTFLSAASAGLKEGPVDAYAGASYKYSDGLRDHNMSILKSAFGRVGMDLSDNEHIGFVYQHTTSKVEDPGPEQKPTPRTDRFDLTTDLYALRFETDREALKGFSLLYFEHGNVDWWQDDLCKTPAGPMDGNAHTQWLNFGFRNFYDWNAWQDLWIAGGLDLADEDGQSETRNVQNGKIPFETNGRLDTFSAYLGAHYDFHLTDDWTLTPSAGSRGYVHSKYDNEFSPHAALSLDWQENVQIFVNGSRGVHYPGVYTRAVSANFASDTLTAETMDYVSGGTQVAIDETTDVLVTIFHTDAQNRIDKTTKGYINAGGMRATGLELSGHWRPTDDLAFFASLTYTNPETSPVSRLPEWTAAAGGTWKICDYLKWTLDGQFIDEMYAYSVRASEDAAVLNELDAGFLLNTRLALPLKSLTPFEGELYVSLENLTNSHYAYYPGYPMDGIMWYFGCKFRF